MEITPLDAKWLDICSNFGLVEIITEPTRVMETSDGLIDHMCVSEDVEIIEQATIKYSISDHFPVLAK